MGSKESIAAGYIEDWHARTRDWVVPDPRQALVIGVDPGNIGAAIQESLCESDNEDGEPLFAKVQNRNIETLNIAHIEIVRSFPWHKYDTVVFANGETRLNWIEDQSCLDMVQVVRNKMEATMFGISEFVRQTIDQAWIKNIVVIGSMAYRSVLNGSAPYCAASAGLVHFARCAAWELAPKGYRVFIVNPSNTEGTPMTEATIKGLMKYRNLEREEAESYWGAVRALPRWLQVENIGEIVTALVTDDNFEWLSGTPLDLGGGLR